MTGQRTDLAEHQSKGKKYTAVILIGTNLTLRVSSSWHKGGHGCTLPTETHYPTTTHFLILNQSYAFHCSLVEVLMQKFYV